MHLCNICLSKSSKIEDRKKNIFYLRCLSCGFIALDSNALIDRVSEKKHYEKHNNSFECTGYVKMFESFISDAVEPYIKNITTALDFGCGHTPVLAELLRRQKLEVDYYDLYFFPKKNYEHKKYDLITSTEVFEHLREPKDILKTLVCSLNDKGYIILMTQFPSKSDEEFLKWWYRRDVTHISFFTPKSFEIMAKEVGLKVLKLIDKNIVVFQKI